MEASVAGVGASAITFETERLVRTLSLQKQAIDNAGDQTLKLIQAAALPPGQGRNLDVRV